MKAKPMVGFKPLSSPPTTAKLVLADKAKKYATKLKILDNGNEIVLYRGFTPEEIRANKEALKIAREEAKHAATHQRNLG